MLVILWLGKWGPIFSKVCRRYSRREMCVKWMNLPRHLFWLSGSAGSLVWNDQNKYELNCRPASPNGLQAPRFVLLLWRSGPLTKGSGCATPIQKPYFDLGRQVAKIPQGNLGVRRTTDDPRQKPGRVNTCLHYFPFCHDSNHKIYVNISASKKTNKNNPTGHQKPKCHSLFCSWLNILLPQECKYYATYCLLSMSAYVTIRRLSRLFPSVVIRWLSSA